MQIVFSLSVNNLTLYWSLDKKKRDKKKRDKMKEACNNTPSYLELLRNTSSNENQVLTQFNFKVNVLFFFILYLLTNYLLFFLKNNPQLFKQNIYLLRKTKKGMNCIKRLRTPEFYTLLNMDCFHIFKRTLSLKRELIRWSINFFYDNNWIDEK